MVLKQRNFDIVSMYVYGLNLGPLAQDHLGPWNLYLNKLGKGLLRNVTYQNFKHLSHVVLKKKSFEYFAMIFFDLNLGLMARDNLEPWDLHLNKLDKGLLGNATHQISGI